MATYTYQVRRKSNALHYSHHQKIRQAINRNASPPNPAKLTALLAPLAKVQPDGRFVYSQHFLNMLDHHLKDKLVLDTEPSTTTPHEDNPHPNFIQFVKGT